MLMKTIFPAIMLLGMSALFTLVAAPAPPRTGTSESNHGFITVGQEFSISNIAGTKVKATVISTNGQTFICSHYHHGWTMERRQYAITNSFSCMLVRGCAIEVFFSMSPTNTFSPGPKRSVGAVYVINGHGEVIKVDDITNVDLTW